ncbi:hypothetical protein SAMN05444398_1173 [Roseovarius pacificus]|uniref:Uncharacterized protein n=1 Tax=Roseovarius pacificus TaxID=337701 RepID=A0A1M7IV95_9RHOB|nr:hypothetical protein SAMN05444398_1173 [Roseovarius pacificus]
MSDMPQIPSRAAKVNGFVQKKLEATAISTKL